ncbi:protein DOWN-REGULATED IN DIF1 11-like [Arachis duranensis]|uniref:Protein DOWN-REGULATED IN DIF1 11-like n=1 Tax=Arachis duranensis TaxID=130453 RepID=A0A6P4DSW8_ARADU|nr:protein DOWN-REGULATED IN DIF1 11-like [Arachis duranensis]XP_057720275.1 protein DOWN-REGULATED IN DIF1 11-like [Arachis stenosperma]
MATLLNICVLFIVVSFHISSASNLAPSPLAMYETYLSRCSQKVAQDCRDEIHSSVVYGNQTVTVKCCSNLVNVVGKQCYDDMSKYVATLPDLKPKQDEILQRSRNVWNACATH